MRTILILALLAIPSPAVACGGTETAQVPRSAVAVTEGQGTTLVPPPFPISSAPIPTPAPVPPTGMQQGAE